MGLCSVTRTEIGRLALLIGLASALLSRPARAEVGSTWRPVGFITPGPSFEMGLDGSMRFGGDVALAQYSGTWGLGAALGFVPGRLYGEAQPAWVLGQQANSLVLGLNPGFVIDVTGTAPRYGGQATAPTLGCAPRPVRAGASGGRDGHGVYGRDRAQAGRPDFVVGVGPARAGALPSAAIPSALSVKRTGCAGVRRGRFRARGSRESAR
jgi:hypothetical protein